MLGYTFVVLGLIVDIGRSWAIWKPMAYWNFYSVLFEVAMCVMFYLNVLYIEFIPIVVERFKGRVNLPGPLSALNGVAETLLGLADMILSKLMWLFIIFLLGTYLALKIGDMVIRETYVYLLDGTAQTNSFLMEMICGVIVPWIMLLSPGVRRSRRWLFTACTLIVGGVLLNRINVFVVGYRPPVSENYYFPSSTAKQLQP
jgi:Ni/Fe-hydrogenase subunit HybB-like protein